MEILLSSVLGELTTRSINFFISKLPNPSEPLDVEDHLSRVLLRAQVIISEAMGRQITNEPMLQQLAILTDAMHRGYYTLDTFRCQTHKEEAKGHRSSLFSVLDSVKDLCFSSGRTSTQQTHREMQEVLDSLSSMIVDVHELVLFLSNYSRMYRQPYNMYLMLGNCMFGRQMEAQFVINFLLHRQLPCVEQPLEVLPIVGPFRVGKSTLVAHVCKDARVRDYFSEIVFLSDLDFRDGEIAAFREGCAMKYRNSTSDYSYKDGTRRLLLVVEGAGDLDEDTWNKLYSSSKQWMPSGSKIIITSRSDKITKLGTTQPLTLKPLSHEAYWYFFKTLAFGSTDPMPLPRLTSLALEIAKTLNGSMIVANIVARMLRDNFDVRFWWKLAAFMRVQFQRNVSNFGGHPYDLLNQNKPVYFGRIRRRSEQVIGYYKYRYNSSQEEVPKFTMHDVTYGDTKLPARFEALAWTSQIPPYYSYICACEVQELEARATKRKRSG